MIRGLGAETVAQIASGDRHSLALTKGGQLFAWGDNTFGQLGVGKAAGLQVSSPTVRTRFRL
jgi:alpha-tubulin suppressor-like RCC1 family protein